MPSRLNSEKQRPRSYVAALFLLASPIKSGVLLRGRGFKVAGVVTTRRTLWMACSGLYGAIGAVAPTLLGDIALGSACAGGGGQLAH